jgi:hypothetical protein
MLKQTPAPLASSSLFEGVTESFAPPVPTASPFIEGDGTYTYEEELQADVYTLRARGFISDFCGAWLALWLLFARKYSATIEAATDEPAAQIMREARDSYMAVISAAVRGDDSKSKVRRFKCAGARMWSYRSGEEIPAGKRDDPARVQVLRNFARYWRAKGWKPIRRFQKATHLALVDRDAPTFEDNRRRADAAYYTDNLTDLLTEIMRLFRSYRGGGRVERFNRAADVALNNFIRRVAPYAPEAGMDESGDLGQSERRAGRARVMSFPKIKEKVSAAVVAMCSRFECGGYSPEQARELLEMLRPALAPLIELAAGESESANEGVVSLADFEQREPGEVGGSFEDFTPPEPPAFAADLIAAGRNGKCDFPAESDTFKNAAADKNIRRTVSGAAPVSTPLDVAPEDFLSAFYGSFDDVRLRTLAPKHAPSSDPRFSAGKLLTSCESVACDEALRDELQSLNTSRGIYFVVNAGGDIDEEISRINAFFVDMDEGALTEQHAKLDGCPLLPSIRVETLRGLHAYWMTEPGCSVSEWRAIQLRLIDYFQSDKSIKNPSRVMRLPGFNHVSYSGGLLSYKAVTVSTFEPSRRFTAGQMRAAFPEATPPDSKRTQATHAHARSDSARGLDAFKQALGARVMKHETAKLNRAGKWDCRGVCHGGRGSKGLFYDPATNVVFCNQGCELASIARAFGLDVSAVSSLTCAAEQLKGVA